MTTIEAQVKNLERRKRNIASSLKPFAQGNRKMTAFEQVIFELAMDRVDTYSDALSAIYTDDAWISGGAPALASDPRCGFKSFGEFAHLVRANSQRGGTVATRGDARLQYLAAAPSTFGSETVGQDGGLAIPLAFCSEIWTYANTEDALLPWTDNLPIGTNSASFPEDETLPWGTDGVRGYWQTEGLAGTQTKPKLTAKLLRMNKLMALVPLSDELLEDSVALRNYLPKRCGMSIRWKANEAILFGLGNGTPLGALQGPAAITQAKESGQATATFDPNNFRNMIGRMPPGSYSRAIWLFGRDCMKPLLGVNFGSYFLNDFNVNDSLPPGLQPPPFKVLGRPAFESQHTAAFSSQGDVVLLDLQFYRAITREGDPTVATSLHLYFDADAAAFRVTFRLDGQPKLVSPIAQAKGTNTLSPFVQLAAR